MRQNVRVVLLPLGHEERQLQRRLQRHEPVRPSQQGVRRSVRDEELRAQAVEAVVEQLSQLRANSKQCEHSPLKRMASLARRPFVPLTGLLEPVLLACLPSMQSKV